MSWWLLLRWSGRDLRRKWVQVAAIALVIAIGTGLFSALGSTSVWRRTSNDDSFALTGMYDIRVRASEGAFADEGSLVGLLAALPDPTVVAIAEERLVVATQVDASTPQRTILVPGRIVGLDVAGGGPRLTIPWVSDGDGKRLSADGDVVLERNFADYYDLRPRASLRLSGDHVVDVGGLGLAPEYFLVTTEEGGFFAQANFAAVFMSLHDAQVVSGHEGQVNDLVLRLRAGTDRDATVTALYDLFADSPLGVTVMVREDDDAYRLLYDDIDGDQKVNDVFAMLVLLGAVFGAFNLSSRMVEAQRREIGIAMALGASRRQLAIRPLLVGAEIALLGAALGVGVGALAIEALRPVYLESLPMPVWHMGFQWAMFARGAALGFALPLVATALPVLRAIRTTPVDAITTTHRDPRSGLSRVVRRLRWPRSAFRRMPIGNVLRTPRRTLLTSLGIAAAIATLVGVLGMLDSFFATIDANDREVLQPNGDRLLVALDTPIDVASDEFTSLAAQPAVGSVEPVLRVGGRLGTTDGKVTFDVLIEALDMHNAVWAPTAARGSVLAPGIVISRVAADHLSVGPGDMVQLTHPALTATGFTVVTTHVPVAAIDNSPYRYGVYLDSSQLAVFGADGVANYAYVLPAQGSTTEDVQRALFGLPGVTSVQPVSAASEVLRDTMNSFTGVFRVLEMFILLLTVLITYNATSINADERARERATLFAFGLPVRKVIALEIAEGLIYGVLGTAVGVALGGLIVRWVTTSVMATTMPELGMEVVVSGSTLALAVTMGVVAVAVAPLLTVRRLRRMDVPGTLRVVE
ncbi:MAG TPA: FtsX-like permease family protein [Ilumatobacteraceae bacterium]|nr:FtsX-like permease family protein [Ilumatobacteraceae bacterium]